MAYASEATLFHDPDGVTWATIPVGTHRETHRLASKDFKRWLGRRLYQEKRVTAGAQAVNDALLVLDGIAANDGPTHRVYTRLAECDGAIYLDLADNEWQAVKVTAHGWQVVSSDAVPVKFRRPKGMLPLPAPTRGGCLDALRSFVNVQSEEDWRLIIAWLLAALHPVQYQPGLAIPFPFPVLALSGEMGSAKTTLARVLRALVDPNTAPVRAEPKELRDLAVSAHNSWALVFDNLSHLPQWLSDALCRLSTGGGNAYRTHYENDEETIFDAQRPIILTGIEELATKGDLVDRAILVHLAAIPDEKRRPESHFWSEFTNAHAGILGALLDAVAGALAALPQTTHDALPRMADFALWITAAEKTLGWQAGDFMKAYQANREGANSISLESSPVAERLMTFMEQQAEWNGTATELYDALTPKPEDGKPQRFPTGWPKNARGLSGTLKRLAPNLRRVGITIEHYQEGDKNHTRKVRVTLNNMSPENASDASDASEEHAKPENIRADDTLVSDATSDAKRSSDANDSLSDAHRTQNETRATPEYKPVSDASDASDANSRALSHNGHGYVPAWKSRYEELRRLGYAEREALAFAMKESNARAAVPQLRQEGA